MTHVSPFLWFNNQAAEARAFYANAFGIESRTDDLPVGDDTFLGALSLPGMDLMLFNGGPHHEFNHAISLFVLVKTQEEVDRLWDGLTAGGGEPGRCGWLTDKFGVSWQIVPEALGRLMSDSNRERAERVRDAMLNMDKLIIADLEAAYNR